METAFYILIYLKTPKGFESFGKFYIGDKEDLAYQLFEKLIGSDERVNDCPLQIDLMETRHNLPVNIKVIGCALEDLGDNCKIITKEAFKILALG